MKNDTFPADTGITDTDLGHRLPLRQRLRSETRERHEYLDARFAGMHLAETVDAYHRFVRMNAACHALAEPILAQSALVAAFPDWTTRDRSSHLSRDMAEMGLQPLAAASPSAAFAKPDLPEAIGMGYVLEGSRVGGRYIYRLVIARLAESAWAAATFHYLESTEEPDRFRDFTIRAEALLSRDLDVDRAVAAANACFDLFIDTERGLVQSGDTPARYWESGV